MKRGGGKKGLHQTISMIFENGKAPLKESNRENLNYSFCEWRSWKGIKKLEKLDGVRQALEACISTHTFTDPLKWAKHDSRYRKCIGKQIQFLFLFFLVWYSSGQVAGDNGVLSSSGKMKLFKEGNCSLLGSLLSREIPCCPQIFRKLQCYTYARKYLGH